MEIISEKQHAHELIERLPPSEVATAVRFLEFMLLDPVARAVATAPLMTSLRPNKIAGATMKAKFGSGNAAERAFRWKMC
jgi:hypothetical protein